MTAEERETEERLRREIDQLREDVADEERRPAIRGDQRQAFLMRETLRLKADMLAALTGEDPYDILYPSGRQ